MNKTNKKHKCSRNGAKPQGEGEGGTRCRKGAKCRKHFLHLLCNGHKTHKKCTQNAAEGVPGRAAAGTAYSEAPKEARNEAPKNEKHHFNSVPNKEHTGENVAMMKQGGTVPEG